MLNVCLKPDISLTPLVELEKKNYESLITVIFFVVVVLVGTFSSVPNFVAPHHSADANKRRTEPYIHSSHN